MELKKKITTAIFIKKKITIRLTFLIQIVQQFSRLALNRGSRFRFHSPPYPFFFLSACFCCLVSLSIEKTPSARLSKLENYGFDQLVSQRDWYHLLNEKSGFWGTCLSWRDVRGRIYEGCVGEVANRVSGGSFRGGRWRYLPFRHHDNRYSAVWIRRYPGLSKNSEDGNSCPKSHKAARFDWSCGKSGQQWDWDYKPKYGYHHDETHSFGSETWWFQRSEWTKRMSCALQLFAPKSQQLNLIFSGSPYRRLGQGRLDNHPVRAMECESFPPLPRLRTLLPSPIQLPL